MSHIRKFLKSSGYLTAAALLFAGWLAADATIFIQSANAAQITNRKVAISTSAPSATGVTYTFTFTVPGAPGTTVQSMDFQFCNNPLPDTDCVIATGQSVTSAALGTPTGLTGWSLGTAGDAPTNTWTNGGSTTGGRIRITRTNPDAISGDTVVSIPFTGIVNPSTANETFYVRLITYTAPNYTTARDSGSVASSTATQITVTAKVQEKLSFSVSATYTANAGAVCTPLSGSGAIALGDVNGVLDAATGYDAKSYFKISTNALNGTVVQFTGDTLKSGSNSITALAAETVSTPGTSQFGIGLDNSDPNHSFTSLVADAGYDEAGGTVTGATPTAKFNYATGSVTTPVTIAAAPTASTITCDSGAVRYVGNISTTTPPGVYTTSIAYIAVPTY